MKRKPLARVATMRGAKRPKRENRALLILAMLLTFTLILTIVLMRAGASSVTLTANQGGVEIIAGGAAAFFIVAFSIVFRAYKALIAVLSLMLLIQVPAIFTLPQKESSSLPPSPNESSALSVTNVLHVSALLLLLIALAIMAYRLYRTWVPDEQLDAGS